MIFIKIITYLLSNSIENSPKVIVFSTCDVVREKISLMQIEDIVLVVHAQSLAPDLPGPNTWGCT